MAAETENERCCSEKPFCLSSSLFSSSAATILQVGVVDKRKFGPRGANSLSTARLLQTGGCCCHLVRGHLTLTFSPSFCLPSTWTSTKQGATSREGRRSSIVCGLASDLICDCRCLPPKRLWLHTWRHNCAASSTLSLHLVTNVYRVCF